MPSLFATLLAGPGSDPLNRDPRDDFWYRSIGPMTKSGQHVTPDRAMQASIVNACVRVRAETFASIPLKVYERVQSGDRREAREYPLFDILHRRPNSWQTSYQFRQLVSACLDLRGNFYAQIVEGARGFVDQLWPIHPDRVRAEMLPNKRIRYTVASLDGSPPQVFTQDEILHIRGMVLSDDGITGLSPIGAQMAAESVGLALAAQDYGSRFFQNDSTPRGILYHPSHFKDDEAREKFRRSWQRAQAGANLHKVAVLEDGIKFEKLGLTNEDAQFLETRKYQDIDICRLFRVPPHKVGILDRATFSNIEEQNIDFVTDTIMPLCVNVEQQMNMDLILAQNRYFIEFDLDGLQRGDMESRYRAYAIARNWGWMNVNEIRAKENLNSIGPDGDEYLRPTNMQPAGEPPEPSGQNQPPQRRQQGRNDASMVPTAWESFRPKKEIHP